MIRRVHNLRTGQCGSYLKDVVVVVVVWFIFWELCPALRMSYYVGIFHSSGIYSISAKPFLTIAVQKNNFFLEYKNKAICHSGLRDEFHKKILWKTWKEARVQFLHEFDVIWNITRRCCMFLLWGKRGKLEFSHITFFALDGCLGRIWLLLD